MPFREEGGSWESALTKSDGSVNKGAFGRAVRNIQESEVDAILGAGFRTDLPDFFPDAELSKHVPEGFFEDTEEFQRPIIEIVTRRAYRDKAFSRTVRETYLRRCAFTGLKIVNGFGRPEVQAAHIRPVSANGPDSVRNGIALSSTMHWMFDRGLLSMRGDGKILKSAQGVPDGLKNLINADGFALVPPSPHEKPHRRFLEYHRDTIFKG